MLDSALIFRRVSFHEVWYDRSTVLSKPEDNKGRFESNTLSEGFPLNTIGATGPPCYPDLKTTTALPEHQIFWTDSLHYFWAIERLCHPNLQTTRGSSMSQFFFFLFPFRKFGPTEPLCFPNLNPTRSGSIVPNLPQGFLSKNVVLSNHCVFQI